MPTAMIGQPGDPMKGHYFGSLNPAIGPRALQLRNWICHHQEQGCLRAMFTVTGLGRRMVETE